MKKSILFAVFAAFALFSCTSNDPNLVTISGTIINPLNDNASFRFKDTSYTASLLDDGSFQISFPVDSATYLQFMHGEEVSSMYVQPGETITMSIDPQEFDETISWTGSPGSSYLAKKYLIREEFDFWGEPFYMKSPDEYAAYIGAYKTNLADELKLLSDSVLIENELAEADEMIDMFAARQSRMQENWKDYGDDVRMYLFKSSEASRNYDFYGAVATKDSTQFFAMLDDFSSEMNALTEAVEDQEFVDKARKNVERQVNSWKEKKRATDNVPKEGEAAIDFTYPDKDGNEISLSDFNGKLVYVDTWASWCGPCVAEIPALKQLEKDYHDKDIVFMSVSVDNKKDDWLRMMEEKQLDGIQLWADGWSQITKDYAIFGIPRFMLFSADGKVISTDAPRPSSADIRDLIDKNL